MKVLSVVGGWAGGGGGKLLAGREAGAGEAGKDQRRGMKGYSNFKGGMTIMQPQPIGFQGRL